MVYYCYYYSHFFQQPIFLELLFVRFGYINHISVYMCYLSY